jgi:hypothetical protein
MTVCTPASACGASSRVSISDSDSGVVTSAAGGLRSWRARSAAGVSPVRWPTAAPGARSASGTVRAFVVSLASARIGVSHSTCSPGCSAPGRSRASAPIQTA